MATRRLLAELTGRIGAATAIEVSLESVGGIEAARRVRNGEAFDVVVLARDVIDALTAEGHIVEGSRVDIATSPIAVAVRAGVPHPDISSVDALQRAVLAAASVGYSTGPSGTHLGKLFADWGIADVLKGAVIVAPPGVPVGKLVATGDVELGFQQLSELTDVDGIDVVGTLPPDVQNVTTFSGGIARPSANRDAARQALEFMAAPDVAEVKRRYGMESAH
jgi:molybdate transport system substrate-binding protein